jgi:hypothetical protein
MSRQQEMSVRPVRSDVPKQWSKKHIGVTQQGKKKSFTSAEGCSHRPESDTQNTPSWKSTRFLSLCSSPWWTGLCLQTLQLIT